MMNDIETTTLKKEFKNESPESLFCRLQESLEISDFSHIKDWFENDKLIYKFCLEDYSILYIKEYCSGFFIYKNSIEFKKGFMMTQCHTS